MINPLQLTFYAGTGYNPSDEPASDAVIDLNEHWVAPYLLKEYDPSSIQTLKVQITDDELRRVDYLKITDAVTGKRWYYYVAEHKRLNEKTVAIRVMIDLFATVGLQNIAFFGNIARRSLSAAERVNYPLLPEPWAPRRPLKTRRVVLDLNVNKAIRLPSHISTTFEEETTDIENTQTIRVPNSPLALTTTPDSLAIDVAIPMGYPNAAGDTSHTITTPWGTVQYTTPYEEYFTLSGTALTTFLAKAKKYNALDLVEPPYYLPSPQAAQTVTMTELSNPNTKNPKASRYYTTLTIRSLASGSSRTYSENEATLQYNQQLAVIVAPDKNGGIFVIPANLRDTGLSAYTYLDGVYSPFETVVYNAVGDTPGKFAADGTLTLNTALNNLFQNYINKVNALQYEGMQAKYFKDLGAVKGVVMSFVSDLLASTSTTVTTTDRYEQKTTSDTTVPQIVQTSTQTQTVPQHTQTQTQSSTTSANTQTHTVTTNMPAITGSQKIPSTPATTQTTRSYTSRTTIFDARQDTTVPSVTTDIPGRSGYTVDTSQAAHTIKGSTSVSSPAVTQNVTGSITTPQHSLTSSASSTTPQHVQKTSQSTWVEPQTTRSTTTQQAANRSAAEGNNIAVNGIGTIYNSTAPGYQGALSWGALQTAIFGGYRNEAHAFMLGNINDYLNRWVSIQNDMHNGKVANLFKNITLLGEFGDHNKLAGKYEILVASLHPDDEANFDMFLDHFGHAVDEYSNALVKDVRDNYNYTMVGEDAILTNNVQQDASAPILNQFRTGVRVWKTLIRPGNY